MLYFQTKNANYSKLWDEKVLLFRGKLVFLLPFVIFVPILVHFSHFGLLHEEKSGNPAKNATAANTHVAKAGFDAKKGATSGHNFLRLSPIFVEKNWRFS
jgi:hypothetical protein